MARGKCPTCKHLLRELVVDAGINGKIHVGKSVKCINFLCPFCDTVVSSQIDPVVLVKTKTVSPKVQKLQISQ